MKEKKYATDIWIACVHFFLGNFLFNGFLSAVFWMYVFSRVMPGGFKAFIHLSEMEADIFLSSPLFAMIHVVAGISIMAISTYVSALYITDRYHIENGWFVSVFATAVAICFVLADIISSPRQHIVSVTNLIMLLTTIVFYLVSYMCIKTEK